MVQKLKELLENLIGKESGRPTSENGDTLVIECEGCRYNPEPCSKECLSCIVDEMSQTSGKTRTILRKGKDVEISGRSMNAIRSISLLKRWSVPVVQEQLRCRRCSRSRRSVMDNLWKGFPELDFDSAYADLDPDGTDERCSKCIRSSLKAVEQLECDIERIRSDILEGCV
ncbi:MAG: hypothetical protein E7Z64_04510 [Thermoplasmata archaeon]|nr:hypothetical protein [Thermoplasmata archaeon]